MDGFDEEIKDLKNTENLSNTALQISRLQAKKDKVDSEQLVVLIYLSIYFVYLIIESFQLMIRRLRSCSAFKKNVSHATYNEDGILHLENVWLNRVSEFNALVRADTSHNMPIWMMKDWDWKQANVLTEDDYPVAKSYRIEDLAEEAKQMLDGLGNCESCGGSYKDIYFFQDPAAADLHMCLCVLAPGGAREV